MGGGSEGDIVFPTQRRENLPGPQGTPPSRLENINWSAILQQYNSTLIILIRQALRNVLPSIHLPVTLFIFYTPVFQTNFFFNFNYISPPLPLNREGGGQGTSLGLGDPPTAPSRREWSGGGADKIILFIYKRAIQTKSFIPCRIEYRKNKKKKK